MKHTALLLALVSWFSPPMINSSFAQSVLKPIQPRFAPDPHIYRGTTVSSTGTTCQTTQSATHALTIEKPMSSLSLRVFAASPITIKIRGKDGTLCRSGLNPEILGAWSAGKYEIWIGSVSGDRVNYQLSLSEASQPEPKK